MPFDFPNLDTDAALVDVVLTNEEKLSHGLLESNYHGMFLLAGQVADGRELLAPTSFALPISPRNHASSS